MEPYECLYAVTDILWHGQKPDLRHLQVFGCTAFAHIEKGHRGKIDPKSEKCVFLGFLLQPKEIGYSEKTLIRLLRADLSDLCLLRFTISRHQMFRLLSKKVLLPFAL